MRLCLVAFAVCVAALLSHAAIDWLGDFVLARDAYDGVPHHSRAMAALAAVFLLAPAGLRFLAAALRATTGGQADLTALLRCARPRNRVLFVAAVLALSVPALAGMEALDVLGAGAKIDDAGDLFAGAPLFSLTLLAAVSSAVALVVYETFALLVASTSAILALLAELLCAGRGRRGDAALSTSSPSARPVASGVLACHGALRAPPLY